MKKSEHIHRVIYEWIVKAENDLRNASFTLTMGDDCPTDTVCFHAQQCAEKYIKALLVYKGKPLSKTHNLSILIAQLPATTPLRLTAEEQEILTEYAVATRYPGDIEEITLAEARKAVRLARKVRKAVRGLLPKEALTTKRKQSR
ncbi:MAG: HEPN domain-containing protein [Nitrospira sp.]|nr:HEPN domain-containing protein [Nitrospira sp.]